MSSPVAATAASYRDGFRNVGISKAAFYKHFEAEGTLVVAVLDDLDAFLQQQQFRRMIKDRGGRTAGGRSSSSMRT